MGDWRLILCKSDTVSSTACGTIGGQEPACKGNGRSSIPDQIMVGYFVSLVIFTTTFALFSLGLNLQWGFTGLINFGHIAFMTLGAYTTVLLSQSGVPLILAVAIGALLAALLGLLIGFSTLRLREDYLAIVTIGVSEVVRLIALNEEWLTRGTRGVYNFPLPLAQLQPTLLVRLGMIGLLTVVLALAGWQFWQWLGTQPKHTLVGSRWQRHFSLVGFLAALGILVSSLWGLIQQMLTGGGLNFIALGGSLLSAGAGMGLIYRRFQQPGKGIRRQSWGTHLVLFASILGAGLVGVAYWAGVLALYDYSYKAGLMWLLVLTLALIFWQLQRWVHSPWGRVLKAIREDEEVPKALGKNVFWYKLQSLMLGGAIAGIAGAFYAWNLSFINPDGFIPLITFQAWTIVVLGGAGNNVGTLLGAAIFWAYDTLTRFILPEIMPLDNARLGAFRIMIIGLILIILMMWRPQGILGKKEELTLGR